MSSINYTKRDLVESLVDEYGIFSDYRDLMIFLAVLGYRENELSHGGFEASGDNIGQIKHSTFRSKQLYKSVLESLAFQHTGNPDALADEGRQFDILEKCAAGGLQVLQRRLGDIKGDPTDALVNLIQSYDDGDNNKTGEELQSILNEFNEDPRVDI